MQEQFVDLLGILGFQKACAEFVNRDFRLERFLQKEPLKCETTEDLFDERNVHPGWWVILARATTSFEDIHM